MPDIDLFPNLPSAVRSGWEVIEAARRYRLTCELSLDTSPPARIYLREGVVYFAERTTDGALGVRLLVEGVINRQQRQQGALVVNGVEHLGQIFERDASIDRGPVELCVEMFTDEVLTSVAGETVAGYGVAMYRRHPSGIDRWYPMFRRNPDCGDVPVPVPVPAAVASEPEPAMPEVVTPVVAVTPAVAAAPFEPPAPAPVLTPAPAAGADDPMVGVDGAALADEVAEAVRRALAAIDTNAAGR